ncbi:MAG: squalene/phytoene synthase family protein [Planctomycetota bacterium]
MNPTNAMDEKVIRGEIAPLDGDPTRRLELAYRQCSEIARKQARNFYYSFLVLPRSQRRAMCALYAFMRLTDDLGDNDAPRDARREWLAHWRQTLDRVLNGEETDGLWWPALADTVNTHRIPREFLHAVIDGVESDLDVCRYQTFTDLYQYCYQVASVVGLSCVRIWGTTRRRDSRQIVRYRVSVDERPSGHRGRLSRGRIYLPADDQRIRLARRF